MIYNPQSAVLAAATGPHGPPLSTQATENNEDGQEAQDDEDDQGTEDDDDDDDQQDGQSNEGDDADDDTGTHASVEEGHVSDSFMKDEIDSEDDRPAHPTPSSPPSRRLKVAMQRHIFDRLQHIGPGFHEGSAILFAWPGTGVVATEKANSFRQTQTDVIMQVSTIRPDSSSATR